MSSPAPESTTTPASGFSILGLALLLGGCFAYVSHQPLGPAEVWGHLKFGQWITEQRRLPSTEPFLSETDQNTPVIHFSWLPEIAFYQAYHLGERLAPPGQEEAGGLAALRLLHALLFTVRMFFLYVAFVIVGRSRLASLAGVALVFFLGMPGMDNLRPQGLAEVCFALMLVGLSLPRLSDRAFFALVALLVAWAQIHGSFMIGLLVMGGADGGHFLQACREAGGLKLRTVWRYEPFRRLFLCILMSMLCIGMLNPAGFGLFRETLAFMRHPAVATLAEWLPLDWAGPWSGAFLASLVFVTVTLLAGIFLLPRRETERMLIGGIPLGQVLLLLFFGWRTVGCQRFILWWLFLTVWVSMSVWGPLWLHFRERRGWQPWRLRPSFLLLFLAGLLVPAVMFSSAGSWLLQGHPPAVATAMHPATPWPIAEQVRHPAANTYPPLKQWLASHHQPRFTGRIYTSADLGDYLLWRLSADQAPLLYGQLQFFPLSHWEACQQVMAGRDGWAAALDRMGATLIVLEAAQCPELRRQLLRPEHRQTWHILSDGQTRWLVAVRVKG